MSNERPTIKSIQEALQATGDPGLAAPSPSTDYRYQTEQAVGQALNAMNRDLHREDARERAEIEALADAMNSVERMRDRNGRRFFSPMDAKAANDIWRILKGIQADLQGTAGEEAWR